MAECYGRQQAGSPPCLELASFLRSATGWVRALEGTLLLLRVGVKAGSSAELRPLPCECLWLESLWLLPRELCTGRRVTHPEKHHEVTYLHDPFYCHSSRRPSIWAAKPNVCSRPLLLQHTAAPYSPRRLGCTHFMRATRLHLSSTVLQLTHGRSFARIESLDVHL